VGTSGAWYSPGFSLLFAGLFIAKGLYGVDCGGL